MADEKSTDRICKRDGFPMVKIRGRWECVSEYLDRCIGQQQVVGLVKRGKTVYCVFENGHALPMLCFCCSSPLEYTALEKTSKDMRRRRLEAMWVGPVMLSDGSEMLQFRLEFSKKGLLSRKVQIPVAPLAAARMRHPDGCPYKDGSPAKKARQREKRRRRKR